MQNGSQKKLLNLNKNSPVESILMGVDDVQPLLETFRFISDELDALHNLLLQESQALKARVAEEIAALALKKQNSVDSIVHQTELQNRFFESRQIPNGEAGLEYLLGKLDKENPDLGELRSYQKKIREDLKRCKTLNERNGASIELMNRHTRRALDILRSGGNPAQTYGPDGNTRNMPISSQRISV